MGVALGEKLRKLRLAAGLTQSEAARRARISRNYLSQLERNVAHQPAMSVVITLADLYGVTVAELLDEQVQTTDCMSIRRAFDAIYVQCDIVLGLAERGTLTQEYIERTRQDNRELLLCVMG